MSYSQLTLFTGAQTIEKLDPSVWQGSYNGKESTLQQLSPYVGKLKSGMVKTLLEQFTKPGDIVLDPFCGSGVVPLEAALLDRIAWANDLSPYAYAITRGKLETPILINEVYKDIDELNSEIKAKAKDIETTRVPEWIQKFYHPETLREIVVAFDYLINNKKYFLISCLLGILHHQRPGFLSYPSSHLVPYLRQNKYPAEQYPQYYAYRDLISRLIAKVKRAYRRPYLNHNWKNRNYTIWQTNSMSLPVNDCSVSAIISSPPYFGALDYARDNRLRLWFLRCNDWKSLDKSLTANRQVYIPQMTACMKEMERVLQPGGYCILVLGDVEKDGKVSYTAEIVRDVALESTNNSLVFDYICDDIIPDDRRTRRETKTTRFERILVMHKRDI